MCRHDIGLLESLYISKACGLCFSQLVYHDRRRYSDGELQFDLEAQLTRKTVHMASKAQEKSQVKEEKFGLRKPRVWGAFKLQTP
jgi:hypothetical protein